MTFFQASHTQWEKCQGWKLRNLHKIIVHTYLWFWLRYINLNIKNLIIIKCLLSFFAHNFFRENNIPHCEMQTWWLQRRTKKNCLYQGRFVYLRMQTQNEKNASAIKSCLPLYFNEKLYLISIVYSTEKLVNIWWNFFLLPVPNPGSS